MKSLVSLILLCITTNCFSQNLTAIELLEKAITYHDPKSNWDTFEDTFTVVMTTPKSPKRTSVISISLPTEYFSVKASKDTITTTYTLDKGKCNMSL